MRPGARIRAAAEVLEDVFVRHQPASTALSDWGKRHRFAGSGDRSAIGTLVYDVLRRRLSLGAQMGSGEPRGLVIAGASRALGLSTGEVAAVCDGGPHTLEPLSDDERQRLEQGRLEHGPVGDAAPYVAADVPEWLMGSFVRAFGDAAVSQGRAMAERAPIDVRVNTIKATREQALAALAPFGAHTTHLAPSGLRIPAPEGPARSPHVESEASHGKGWFEVQDEGSQIVAALSGAGPGRQVLDLCAGAGGKTLAMAASMDNSGQIYAYDSDKRQLRPIFDRLQRAGVRNAHVLDGGDRAGLAALGPRFDVVLADAPCSGSGTWRRKPDAKWRLRPESLATRQVEQRQVLTEASGLVKPGGRLIYATCSVLPEENVDQVAWFLEANPGFSLEPYGAVWRETIGSEPPVSADGSDRTLLLSPASHGTDGFFVALFRRKD